ncbi:hypothetical protein FA10DRAFT_258716 [Acaromyces ingoldii]|uniref:Uncharacterized protein n=1 Tax=Acaromyces ingoldii TaxID=215250 RepID=A0A316YPV1_9BASI|nr:hypothetical protein FA10DRAFT_258716 [Acaromyces ingoldii]PWN91309.1 hypothetical protein FA10DRAFT_258716 [Acaromyces ingoldii]
MFLYLNQSLKKHSENNASKQQTLSSSRGEEEWLKETLGGEIKTLSMENELNEAETKWEKLFALLKMAMEAYEFNQPAITPDTREKLGLMFYNIVVRKEYEVQQEELRKALWP